MKHCLFLGDSITDANHFFSENPLGDGFVSLIGETLCSDQYQLENRGHDGFTIEQLWRMIHRDGLGHFDIQTTQTHPPIDSRHSIITILIGVNDIPVEIYTNRNRIPEEYEYYYRKILDYVKNHSYGKIILVEAFVFDKPALYKPWQTYINIESQIIQKLAKEYGAAFLPANQRLQEACTKWGTAAITTDGLHLTELGNQILANLWLAALGDVL